WDEPRQETMRLDLAEPLVAVDDEDAGGFLDDLERGAGDAPTVAEGVDILEDADEPVRVVAAESGAGEAASDARRLVGGDADGGEKLLGETGPGRCGELGHDRGLQVVGIVVLCEAASCAMAVPAVLTFDGPCIEDGSTRPRRPWHTV